MSTDETPSEGAATNGHDLFSELRRTGNPALRDQIVTAHLGLAEYLARRFANRGESLDDLVQVASMALVKAVDRFDPARGLEFSTYATPTIVGELKRHFRDKGWAMRVPRRLQELHLSLNTIVNDLTHDLGRSPTIAQIAQAASVSEETVVEALEAGQAYRFTSLDAPGPGEQDVALGESLGTDDPRLARADDRAELSPLLDALEPRDRLILHLRFFDGRTQSEIATELGMSQMHVSRLLARSLARLREAAEQGQD